MNARSLLCVAIAMIVAGGAAWSYAASEKSDRAELEKKLQAMLKARVESATMNVQADQAAYDSAGLKFSERLPAWRRLAEARAAVTTSPEEKINALREYAEQAAEVERVVKAQYETGSRAGTAAAYYQAKYEAESAQIDLLKAELAAQH